MPQMSPMNWVLLMLGFFIVYFLFILFIYFLFKTNKLIKGDFNTKEIYENLCLSQTYNIKW